MRNRRVGEIECDSCGCWNDGWYEPGQYDHLAAGIRPENAREVQWFWLCGECSEDYPNGPKDFYVEDFWDKTPWCEQCDYEEVERWGHWCDDCMAEDNEEVMV
jgi:hypothetical protein